MPIFQDDLDHPDLKPLLIGSPSPASRRFSDESLRTDLCEGPIPDSPRCTPPDQKPPDDDGATSSRKELIERLKRGQSPTWIPTHHLESVFDSETLDDERPKSSRSSRASSHHTGLLPAADITPEEIDARPGQDETRLQDGLGIERPRSALHTGDFTTDVTKQPTEDKGPGRPIHHPAREDGPWIVTSPPRDYRPFEFDARRASFARQTPDLRSYGTSPLSFSPSLSSSLAYQPPTSPLAQSESNDDFDGPADLDSADSFYFQTDYRRHTFGPLYTPRPYSSPLHLSPSFAARPSRHRRLGSLPSQAHQPRRSLNSTPGSLPHGSPLPPSSHVRSSRRQSFGSDISPIQHASMVGSYEESILRGRMSTTPSKPLEFMAQIGVLGMGDCRPSLKCPPHVTLPFAAVYYSYGNTPHGRSRSDDGPSPYVGQIDLENGLSNSSDDTRSRRKARSRYSDRAPAGGADVDGTPGDQRPGRGTGKTTKTRRAASPRAPPGGSYRIPEKGQLQIIIKNQNKTAVKLFLVPYDLAGMEPGTKTFIRQRCYSAGPILDGIPNSAKLGPSEKPTLRYLIHLHICSPAKGRYFLYKSVRVVFANRVPDGKEKLRSDTTMPEPRFTPYKPIRVMHPLSSASGPGATLAADKAFRRRSAGLPFPSSSSRPLGAMDVVHAVGSPGRGHGGSAVAVCSSFGNDNLQPLDPIPLRLPPRRRVGSEASNATSATAADALSPTSSQGASRPSTKDSGGSPGGGWDASRYAKLSKGDAGYGGLPFGQFSPAAPGAEGLLSQRLRSIGMRSPPNAPPPWGAPPRP